MDFYIEVENDSGDYKTIFWSNPNYKML
jgi:hypothetical protein